MLGPHNIRKNDMPKEMRFLFDKYPRDSWPTHPGFADRTRHWLGAHKMFRHVAERIRLKTEDVLDAIIPMDDYAHQLSQYGGVLVTNLHGHHGWEDRNFFPELMAADPRFKTGLDLLEKDHADLDTVLDRFTQTANRLIKLSTMDEAQALQEAGHVHETGLTIEAFLKRHLGDEEELSVPIILHYRLRG
jgi:hypothetical protein